MKNYNRLLLILKFLYEQTDENHSVSIKDINDYLDTQCLGADRKTISECIIELQNAGYDIVYTRSTQNRYFMQSRPFTLAEVKVLVDAIQSSRFIPETQSRELIEKLSLLVGTYKGDILKRQLYIGSREKSDNEDVPSFVETIHSAILANRKIQFQYYDYNAEKEKVLKQEGRVYVLSPLSMVWNNDMYYVVGCGDYSSKVLKFRLDRMANLSVAEEERVAVPGDYNISDFFEKEFSMMGGKTTTVELVCENELMDSVIDKFGKDVNTEILDSAHFMVTVDVKVSGLFFGWVFASRGAMRIVAPIEVVDKFNNVARSFLSEELVTFE